MSAVEQVACEIRIEPIHDERLIASAIRHPRIYPHVSDDGCPDAASFKVVLNDAMRFLGVYEGGRFHGLFVIHAHNFVLYEVHTCLLPSIWGERAISAARALVAWVFAETSCRRLVTSVPQGNVLAMRLARAAGLVEYGINPRSLMRGGVLIDQVLLGIDKDQSCR